MRLNRTKTRADCAKQRSDETETSFRSMSRRRRHGSMISSAQTWDKFFVGPCDFELAERRDFSS
jgi:hypothetical protein